MFCFFFSSRRRHTRLQGDWSSDVCSSDLNLKTLTVARSLGSQLPAAQQRFDAVLKLARTERLGEIIVGARLKARRSEERRVGKECRSGWWPQHSNKKDSNKSDYSRCYNPV